MPKPSPSAEAPVPAPAQVQYSHEPRRAEQVTRVTRVVRQHNYLLEHGDYEVEVDATDGGRIVAFRIAGQNALIERSASPEAYGSSFWPSPQSLWRWPPPFEFDQLAWQAKAEQGRLLLESGTHEKLGLGARQVLSFDPERSALVIEYTLENRGTQAIEVAPWQNTRMPPGGLTFFPSSGGSLPPSTLDLEPDNEVVWMRHDPANKQEGKVFADGSEGWLAHLGGDLLLVKVFPDVPRERQAPGEAEIEIYVHASGLFVEVEQQGEYLKLAPGASSSWTVRWLLEKLPAQVAREPGPALLEHTRELVGSARGE